MKSLQMMRELKGETRLVLADNPLFSNKLTKWIAVDKLESVPIEQYPHVICYNGIYAFDCVKALCYAMLGIPDYYRLITTKTPIKAVMTYVDCRDNFAQMHTGVQYEVLRQLCGHFPKDEYILLWLCLTDCDVDLDMETFNLRCMDAYTLTNQSTYSGYTEMMGNYINVEGDALTKLIIDCLREIVNTPLHSEERKLERANTIMTKCSNGRQSEQLLLFLRQIIKLLRYVR